MKSRIFFYKPPTQGEFNRFDPNLCFHLVRRDYSGMLIVFPIVQHLKDEQPIAHNKALKFCSDDNRKGGSQNFPRKTKFSNRIFSRK